jgi:hypothetical protein
VLRSSAWRVGGHKGGGGSAPGAAVERACEGPSRWRWAAPMVGVQASISKEDETRRLVEHFRLGVARPERGSPASARRDRKKAVR